MCLLLSRTQIQHKSFESTHKVKEPVASYCIINVLHTSTGRNVPDLSKQLLGALPCVWVLLEELNEAAAASSESSGMGSGEGNWMLVRSGREPPVLWAAGFSDVVSCWSGDGNMLQKADECSEEYIVTP